MGLPFVYGGIGFLTGVILFAYMEQSDKYSFDDQIFYAAIGGVSFPATWSVIAFFFIGKALGEVWKKTKDNGGDEEE